MIRNDPYRNIYMQKGIRAGALFIALVWLALPLGMSAEPAYRFLNELRKAGYFDTAVDYLERMKDSSLAPEELREAVLFERGIMLLDGLEHQQDPAIREKQLDAAQKSLTQFVAEHPNHLKATAAELQVGNLLSKRANNKLQLAKIREQDRAPLTAEARKLFNESFQVLTRLEAAIRTRRDQSIKQGDAPADADNPAAKQRKQLREDHTLAMLFAGMAREGAADTVERDSKEYQELLAEAVARYKETSERNRGVIFGLLARQYQGRCYYKMSKIKDAISLYSELLDESDSAEPVRQMKMSTMPLILTCLIHDSEKKYQEAIRRGEEWLSKARSVEERSPDWLETHLLVARAYASQADALEKADPKDRQLNENRVKARKHAQVVARFPSGVQREAQQLLVTWGGHDKIRDKSQIQSFAEANEAGKNALDAMQGAELMLQQLNSRIASEKDDAAKARFQGQVKEIEQSSSQKRAESAEYFQLALQLAEHPKKGEEVSSDDVNLIRYYLCFFRYAEKDFYDAAVLGEFIARRYPDSSHARQSARIALASYISLFSESPITDRAFENRAIVRIADYITAKWPGHAEADEAVSLLIPLMISAGNVAKAEEYLQKIPIASAKRADAELRTGQAMWGSYLKGMQALRNGAQDGTPASVNLNDRQKQLDELKARCQKVLADGVARTQESGAISSSTAMAVLSLIQVYLDTGNVDNAKRLIDDPKLGLLTLLQNNDSATLREGFADEAYRTILRSYISELGRPGDHSAAVQKAQRVMDTMKSAAGSTADGQSNLVSTYLSLARDLEQQLQLAPPEAKKSLSAGFELFLNKVRDESPDFTVRNWVADTYRKMGKELMVGGRLTPDSQRFVQEASKAYEAILSSSDIDASLKSHVRLQLAICQRELGEYTKAIPLFEQILKENSTALNIQVEAARTYQLAGTVNAKNNQMLVLAILGDKRDPKTQKNTIWGWGRIAQLTSHKPQFVETFHEARYNLALCRYQYALNQADAAQRKKQLDLAEQDVGLTVKLFKDIGGPQWRARYEALIKQIQKANDKLPVGLPEVDDQPKAAG